VNLSTACGGEIPRKTASGRFPLNVTVTAGMILAEAQRQREEAGFYDAPRLPEAEWRALLKQWLRRELEQG